MVLVQSSSANGEATIEAMRPGFALVTATDGASTIRRYVAVGEVFAYVGTDGVARGAPSDAWKVPDPAPTDLPSGDNLKDHGLAYVPGENPKLVLNFECLEQLVRTRTEALYFKATAEGSSTFERGRLGAGVETYAYAKDTFWRLDPAENWKPADRAYQLELPSFEAMGQDIAIAWKPPPTTAFCVTCFVLNQDAFPGHFEDEITYYTLS
ncbi:MAG: hypothetical protein R3B70_47270 [Polyangiaceae bacterium]